MKAAFLILCMFFLKTTADAQQWQQISPNGITGLKKMDIFTVNNDKYIVAYSDTILFTKQGENAGWKKINSVEMQCITPPTTERSKFFIHGVVIDQNGHTYIANNGRDCYQPDGSITTVIKYDLQVNNISDNVLDKNSCSFGGVTSSMAVTPQGRKYFFAERAIYYFDTLAPDVTMESLPSLTPPNPDSANCGPVNTKIFRIDPRNSKDFYMTVLTTQQNSYTDNLFKSNGKDSTWKLIATTPIDQLNNGFKGGFHTIAFPVFDSASIYLASDEGLWKVNVSNGEIDTLIATPIHSITTGETSTGIFAGTETGNLYYIYETGNKALVTSDSLQKPIIDLYFDQTENSIYAATENAVWRLGLNVIPNVHEDTINSENLKITPNPANSSLKINFLKTELPQQLSIYNSLGQIVFKSEFSGEFVWDFKSNIPDGIYTVSVQSGEKSVIKQVVIIR
ncbi:MAG: T9SS type A sorting domain-containing protein [Bacteroidota bacterium]